MIHEELITVKDQAEPVVLTVAETVHGPIVSRCAGDHGAAYDAAQANATVVARRSPNLLRYTLLIP